MHVRQGTWSGGTSWHNCSPNSISDPLIKPEADCRSTLGSLIEIKRFVPLVNKFGLCSVGILTDCKCDQTSFISKNINRLKYFSGPLISPTSFNLLMYTSTSAQTYVNSLTDSVSLICGDRTGKKWCGNRAPVIWDVAN